MRLLTRVYGNYAAVTAEQASHYQYPCTGAIPSLVDVLVMYYAPIIIGLKLAKIMYNATLYTTSTNHSHTLT